ncbi:MAG: hypothetical protein ACYC7F_12245 [Gemmatimonadaceae bacterium]
MTFIATATAGTASQLVKISGDAQTGVTGNPLGAPMVVEARDALNNPVAGVSIGFAAIAGGGAPATQSVVTDGAGRASFTLTLGAPGADTVKACLPSCATAQVLFAALSVPVGTDATWTGAVDSAWGAPGNWSPAVVPGAANKVFIPAGLANNPVLSADISLADLTMAPGAMLALGARVINVGGSVHASGATMSGSGHLYFCGGAHAITGRLAAVLVDCGATVSASGADTISGWLETRNGSVFDVAAATTMVTGDVRMTSGARIKMITAGGHLIVGGNYDSDPGNDVGDSWMTDGVLELKGNLTATNSCCSQSFRAVGNHVTRFSGSGAQSVNFYYTDNYSRSTFGNVEFTGNNTVTLANNMRVRGAVNVTGTTKVAGGTLYHGGQLITGGSTDLSGLGYTQLTGGGAVFPLIAGVGPGEVQLAGNMTVTLPQAAVTLPTNLTTHSGAVLDLEGKTLVVTGNYGMYSSSRVKMTQAAARFTVDGSYDSNPGGDIGDTWMTDGVLELKGNLTATNSCCSQSFRAVGNHLTRFSGAGPQSVNFYYTDNYTRSTFGNVEFTGNNTVTLANNMRVHGAVSVGGSTKVAGGTLHHGGQLTTGASTDLSGLGYTQLNGGGAVFPLIAGVGPGEVQIAGAMTVTLPQAAVTLPTTLTTHWGAVLDLEGKVLTVTGNYGMYSGSRVKMTQAAAHFAINGNYDSDPGGDIGDLWMTDGVLELKGNLTATNSCCSQSFRAVGNHVTRFSGAGAQSVNFYYTDNYSRSTFGNVEFTGNNTVTLANNMRVHGAVSVAGTTKVVGGAIYHGGQLTTAASTDLSGLGFAQLTGGGAVFPLIAGVGPGEVQIAGAMTVSLPQAAVTLPTNLTTHSGAVLDLGGNALTVSGNYGMYSGSRVKMVNTAALMTVLGNADFNPGGDIGDSWFTAGTLDLKGNFSATNSCCGQSFRATGTHLTRFSGTGAQSIAAYYPSATQTAFMNVEVTNASVAGAATASSMYVLGAFTNLGRFTVNTGHTLTVGGAVVLGGSSHTTNSGGVNKPSCIANPGAVHSGFSCP